MNKQSDNRNIRAHKKLNKIGFPHRIINLIVFEKVRDCLKKIPNINHIRPRLLDVGCGTGYLLKKMLAQGLDAWGLDPYPRIEAARESLSKRVIAGSIEDVPDEPFQIITAVEVLEHVEDYMKLLESMKELLSPNGFIIITVPNKWEFRATYSPDHKSLESDLKCFSKEVYIEQIYSRNLDRRLLKITRVLPSVAVIKLSKILVTYRNDGAWLLGVMRVKRNLSEEAKHQILLRPSANYYKNDPYFIREI
jgi:2-polyprenyl-3-methyl-5-hydroxy-6-metoxy-1,4-benzoquinol methylase